MGTCDTKLKWYEILGIFGLYTFAFFAFLGIAGANLGLIIMLIAILIDGKKAWKAFHSDPLFWLFIVFILYVCGRAYFAANEYPNTEKLQWRAAYGWIRPWFFLLAAWWFQGNNRRIGYVFLLCLLGLTLDILLESDVSIIKQIVTDDLRFSFGYVAIFVGLISGITLTGLFIYSPYLIHNYRSLDQKLPLVFCIVALFCLFAVVHISSQSRGSWLAFLGAIIVMIVVTLWHYKKNHQEFRKFKIATLLTTGLLFIVIIIAINSGIIKKRFNQSAELTNQIIHQGVIMKDIPFTPLGYRIHMLYFGLNRFIERPVTGWGPGTIVNRVLHPEDMDTDFERNQLKKLNFSHLHNGYLTTLVRVGLIGFILLGATGFIVILKLQLGYLTGGISPAHSLFLLSALIQTVIWNLSDSRIIHVDFGMLMVLLGGAIVSWSFHEKAHGKKTNCQ